MEAHESSVMAALPPHDRRRLLDRAVPRTLEPAEALYFAGERAHRIHLILSGIMKFVARDGSGNETILGLAAPGDVVGDIAALDDLPHPLDVIAATTVDVIGMDAEAFMEATSGSAAAARALLEIQTTRLRWLYATTLERSAGGVPARLAGRLLDLADMIGRIEDGAVTLEMPLPQTDLGRLAGICRESACKTMRRFKSDGYVDYRGRKLRILRPDVLERIRCAGRA